MDLDASPRTDDGGEPIICGYCETPIQKDQAIRKGFDITGADTWLHEECWVDQSLYGSDE